MEGKINKRIEDIVNYIKTNLVCLSDNPQKTTFVIQLIGQISYDGKLQWIRNILKRGSNPEIVDSLLREIGISPSKVKAHHLGYLEDHIEVFSRIRFPEPI